MSEKTKVHLLKCLEDYLIIARRIDLLQCELSANPVVTEDEVLMALALSREEGASIPVGKMFDKTSNVALQYRDLTEKLNGETKASVLNQLCPLKARKERLDRCITLLSPVDNRVITGIYIQKKTIKDLALELHVSERTIQRYRDNAIDELVSMCELLEQVGIFFE